MKKKSKNNLDNLKEQQTKKFFDYIFIYQEDLDFRKIRFLEIYYENINNFLETATRDELANLVSKNGNKLFTEREINILLKAQEFALNPKAKKYRQYRCKIRMTREIFTDIELVVKALAPDDVNYDNDDYEEFVKNIAFEKLNEFEEKALEDSSKFEFGDGDDQVIEMEWIGDELAGLKQKSSPNIAQTSFIRSKQVAIES